MTALTQRREYSPSEIQEALTVVAYFGGNCARASRELDIPEDTLGMWRRRTHREKYLEIAEREGPTLEAIAAHQAREAILRSSDVEHGIFDRLSQSDDLTSKELSELAGALQRISTSKGINTTKLLELTGRPTQVVQHLSPQEAIRGLARDLGISIEGTADEIPTAEVPSVALPSESTEPNAREANSS